MSIIFDNTFTRKHQKTIYIALLLVCVSLTGYFFFRGQQLRREHRLTIAKIVDFYWAGRGTNRWSLEGEFSIGGKHYTASCNLSCQDLKSDTLRKYLLNKTFPVVYNPSRPQNNYLLLDKAAYESFNVLVPDSLKQTVELLECR